jgi:hypothetical protein
MVNVGFEFIFIKIIQSKIILNIEAAQGGNHPFL